MQRRVFLKSGALALVTMGLSPSFLRRSVFAQNLVRTRRGKVLICLFQRGAADGLNVVVPFGEKTYYDLRPNLAIAQPGRPSGASAPGALDLDGFFGLHPSLAPMKPLWDRGLLAPIHAVGSPSATRSHFDAQDYMETATPDRKDSHDGWLNRYLAVRGTCESCATHGDHAAPHGPNGSELVDAKGNPFRAVSMTAQTPRILSGPAPSVAMSSIDDFTIRASGSDAEARLEALYTTGSADLIHGAGSEMFEAMKMLRAANPKQYAAQNGADYPRTQFGQRLAQIAQLIKADVGLEIAFADIGGWDTHVNQGSANGQLANRLDEFSKSIAALVTDLGDRMDDVVILTMSEFGRTARQNGTGGTDHGHAGTMFVIGEQLNEGRDLALTTDFRSVFAEITSKHLGATDLTRIFPGFNGPNAIGVL